MVTLFPIPGLPKPQNRPEPLYKVLCEAGNTFTPSLFSAVFTTLLNINACGSEDKLCLSTTIPAFFKFSMTAATLISSGSIEGPHTPVEQHIAGNGSPRKAWPCLRHRLAWLVDFAADRFCSCRLGN